MTRSRLIVIGPLPPPIHGVTVSTSLVLASPALREHFEVLHLDTSDHRSGTNVGRWDLMNIWAALRAICRLAALLRGPKGIVYLPLSQSTPGFCRDSLFVLLSHAAGWRVAVHLRGGEFRSYFDASTAPWQRWIRLTLRRVASAAVMGESLRSIFDGLVDDNRIAVVPNGTPEPRPVNVRRDENHVLFLSNLRRRKGIVESVRAALLVRERHPSARFTFAGNWESGELERELRTYAQDADGSIRFTPGVQGAAKDGLLASASVLLFPPTQSEGHPRVVLEALAAGVPVVTTNRGAIGEIVVDGESGYVIDDSEPAALADRILRLLRDESLRERLSQAARTRYLSHFTQDRADRRLADWLVALADED